MARLPGALLTGGTDVDHKHYGGYTDCVEVGSGVCLSERSPHLAGEVRRFTFSHDLPAGVDREGFRCEGGVTIRTDGKGWTEQGSLAAGDLTISPLILCKGLSGCGGIHGFVRDGKWVPA